MCYNCGCGVSNDDMGHPQNITDKTFAEAAKAMGQTAEEAKKETLKLLQKQLKQAWLFDWLRFNWVREIYFYLPGIIPLVGEF